MTTGILPTPTAARGAVVRTLTEATMLRATAVVSEEEDFAAAEVSAVSLERFPFKLRPS
jgi:hypothetical protein